MEPVEPEPTLCPNCGHLMEFDHADMTAPLEPTEIWGCTCGHRLVKYPPVEET